MAAQGQEKAVRVAILGASGYTGAELVRLLLSHRNVEISVLTGNTQAGQEFSAVYPQFSFAKVYEYHSYLSSKSTSTLLNDLMGTTAILPFMGITWVQQQFYRSWEAGIVGVGHSSLMNVWCFWPDWDIGDCGCTDCIESTANRRLPGSRCRHGMHNRGTRRVCYQVQ